MQAKNEHLRARVILACATGKTNTQVSAEMRLSKPAVGKWSSRFVARRLDGLLDEPVREPRARLATRMWNAC